ncbi:hypothetical protein PUH89_12400 [Rhodobacter capsulatus]|uniref:hypothetical protein n=1 Tax=Rhodobacter capsulatus TaxID=1061 RepID=UPI0023E12104|nr:hypothetical protein [Rhodobacter capsulatus]WER08122.1 hypothetical protein PUH89_12400 [Rhodobacter capsulatus]
MMREVGLALMRQGREVALTILMEQGRFLHYPGATLLLFGAGSYLNPYGQIAAPEQVFRSAYPAGHHVEILRGAHGVFQARKCRGAGRDDPAPSRASRNGHGSGDGAGPPCPGAARGAFLRTDQRTEKP